MDFQLPRNPRTDIGQVCEYKLCRVPYRPGGEKLLVCAGCKFIRYCSTEHQKLDWKRHKPGCKLMSTNADAKKDKKENGTSGSRNNMKDILKLCQIQSSALNAQQLANHTHARKKAKAGLKMIHELTGQFDISYMRAIIFQSKIKLLRVLSTTHHTSLGTKGDNKEVKSKTEVLLLKALHVVETEFMAEPAASKDEGNEVKLSILCEVAAACCHNGNNDRAKKYLRDAEAHMEAVSLTLAGCMKQSTRDTYYMAKSMVERLGGNSKSALEILEKLVEGVKSKTPVNYIKLVEVLFDYSAAALQAKDHTRWVDSLRQIVEASRIDPTNLHKDPQFIQKGMTCVCRRKQCEGNAYLQEIYKISRSAKRKNASR